MRGYLVPKGIHARLIVNGGQPQPFVTTKEQMFFEQHLKVDPIWVMNGREVEPKYQRYNEEALRMVHGFELSGNKHIDSKYLLLVEGKDIIIG